MLRLLPQKKCYVPVPGGPHRWRGDTLHYVVSGRPDPLAQDGRQTPAASIPRCSARHELSRSTGRRGEEAGRLGAGPPLIYYLHYRPMPRRSGREMTASHSSLKHRAETVIEPWEPGSGSPPNFVRLIAGGARMSRRSACRRGPISTRWITAPFLGGSSCSTWSATGRTQISVIGSGVRRSRHWSGAITPAGCIARSLPRMRWRSAGAASSGSWTTSSASSCASACRRGSQVPQLRSACLAAVKRRRGGRPDHADRPPIEAARQVQAVGGPGAESALNAAFLGVPRSAHHRRAFQL